MVYRMQGPAPGAKLPHDLRHFVVERELRLADGLWGSIAAGIVYTSMEHVRGRRPPHAAEAARWARLRVGEELVYSWPTAPIAATRALRAVPRPREAGDRRDPRRTGKRGPR